MARCAVCLASFAAGDAMMFRDIYLVHRACVSGAIAKESELRVLTTAKTSLETALAQANKNARASIDHAQKIEAKVFADNASVHARVAVLEADLAAERSRRAAAEAALELQRRLPTTPAATPATEEISKPEKDASSVRFGLLELD